MHIVYPAVVSALLFSIGVYGVLARRNTILVLMSVELMLNAVNLNLVAFDVWLRDRLHSGQVLTLFVIVIAAAEVGLGLAIVLALYRNRRTVDIDHLRDLAEPTDDPPVALPADAGNRTASVRAQSGLTVDHPAATATPSAPDAGPGSITDPDVVPASGAALDPGQSSHDGPASDEDRTGVTSDPHENRRAQEDAKSGHEGRDDTKGEQPVKRGGRR
ncbi:NADH:ubiquinone oxidoreductase subunit K [Nonomuraea polychroma]|uniref:NADH-quinone oxidoreductase subunit K n=1 Tax=Nonomuraea polychroma TaxID=46176 RepID=A0A438MLN7_9ACTN|nr:NADH:ubiquinone oxidoreductase subunit K [Nonomuraea polychroma]